jgi:hypothetical protein
VDGIVKDSSIYKSKSASLNAGYGEVRVGIVREENFDSSSSTFYYLVEIQRKGRRSIMSCRRMVRFGDPYNYEEWNLRPNKDIVPVPLPNNYKTRVGEVVVVAPIDGNYADGVILGSLRHPAHKPKIKSGEVGYATEFNGLETTIDKDGAYKVKFQGTSLSATVAEKLPSGSPIPAALYNPVSAGSYFTFSKDGSYEVSDASLALPQSIKMDKPGGKFTIKSGLVTIEIDKLSQKIAVSCLDHEIKSTKSFKVTTLDTEISSLKSVKIKSAKIAIGFGGTELFDTIIKLIDAFGTLIVNSPVGPCSPLMAAPTWAQVVLLKTQLQLVKGSL